MARSNAPDSPWEIIGSLPVVRQDAPTVSALQTELTVVSRLVSLPNLLGILTMAWIIGVGALMLALAHVFPEFREQSNEPGTFARTAMLLWFVVIPIGFAGGLGLPPILSIAIVRRFRGREQLFCDPQLLGELIDLAAAAQSAASNSSAAPYSETVVACIRRILPEVTALDAASLTDRRRDFLAERALTWQSAQPEFALAAILSAPVWGDTDMLAALMRIADTGETEAIRASARASFAPLAQRLASNREIAALVGALHLPALRA